MNLNDKVTVILTEYGKKILDHYRLNHERPLTPDLKSKFRYDENGVFCSDLGQILNIFGRSMFNGSKQVFKDNDVKIGSIKESTLDKSRDEIEALKTNWVGDPCWDIEYTEGFEKYKDELLIFRLETQAEWLRLKMERCNELGCSPAMLNYIFALENRIMKLEENKDD